MRRRARSVGFGHFTVLLADAQIEEYRWRLLVKPTGEIAQQPLGLIGIVELPSLPDRPAYRRISGGGNRSITLRVMNLAALDGCVGTEGATDDFAQRFGAIDDAYDATPTLVSEPAPIFLRLPLHKCVGFLLLSQSGELPER